MLIPIKHHGKPHWKPGTRGDYARTQVLDKAPAPFRHYVEVEAHFAYTEAWADDLTPNEKISFVSYTSAGYSYVNKFLRNGEIRTDLSTIKQMIAGIDSGLEKTRLQEDILVFRGTQSTTLMKMLEEGKIKKGDVMQDRGYMSTSALQGAEFNGTVKFNIHAPKGSKAVYISSLSRHPDEFEVLFARDTRMKILDITEMGDKRFRWYELDVKVEV